MYTVWVPLGKNLEIYHKINGFQDNDERLTLDPKKPERGILKERNQVLFIPSLANDDEGEYKCEVWNKKGSDYAKWKITLIGKMHEGINQELFFGRIPN